MTINWIQAAILGLFACLVFKFLYGWTSGGNYTIGRPLVGGLVCGIILGDLKLGIACGSNAISLHCFGHTWRHSVADVRAISYIDSFGDGGDFDQRVRSTWLCSRPG